MTPTNWIPGLIVLAAGLLGAIAYLLVVRKNAPARLASDEIADLDRRANRLVEQIKELQADRHHLDETQFAAEKQRLEQEAVEALRRRDEAIRETKPVEKTQPPPSPSFLKAHPQLTGALWGGGVVLFFVVLGLFLSQEQRPRTEGREATGRTPPGSGSAEEDPELSALMARLAANPDNIDLLSAAAHEMLDRQQWDQASSLTDRALGLDPFSLENRIHRSFLKAIRGDVPTSTRELRHLADRYPAGEEALLFLGTLSMQSGNMKQALYELERYSVEAPTDRQPPRLKEAIATLRKQLATSSK